MNCAYTYKIKPTMKQCDTLSQCFGCVRFIYNWGLKHKVDTYNESKKTLTYNQLAKELTRSALEETGNTELDNFKCESTSYMLCKKYGIDVSDININSIPEAFKNMSASEVRNELTSMRSNMEDINTRMSAYFETISKAQKNKEHER